MLPYKEEGAVVDVAGGGLPRNIICSETFAMRKSRIPLSTMYWSHAQYGDRKYPPYRHTFTSASESLAGRSIPGQYKVGSRAARAVYSRGGGGGRKWHSEWFPPFPTDRCLSVCLRLCVLPNTGRPNRTTASPLSMKVPLSMCSHYSIGE